MLFTPKEVGIYLIAQGTSMIETDSPVETELVPAYWDMVLGKMIEQGMDASRAKVVLAECEVAFDSFVSEVGIDELGEEEDDPEVEIPEGDDNDEEVDDFASDDPDGLTGAQIDHFINS